MKEEEGLERGEGFAESTAAYNARLEALGEEMFWAKMEGRLVLEKEAREESPEEEEENRLYFEELARHDTAHRLARMAKAEARARREAGIPDPFLSDEDRRAVYALFMEWMNQGSRPAGETFRDWLSRTNPEMAQKWDALLGRDTKVFESFDDPNVGSRNEG